MVLQRSPTEHPLILGDIVLAGSGQHGNEEDGDIPALVEQLLFGSHGYLVQATRGRDRQTWHDTLARFDNPFDAAMWCSLFRATMGQSSHFRLVTEVSGVDVLASVRAGGGGQLW